MVAIIKCPNCGGELKKRPSRVTNYVDGEPMGDALEFNPAHVRCKSCLTEFKFNGS